MRLLELTHMMAEAEATEAAKAAPVKKGKGADKPAEGAVPKKGGGRKKPPEPEGQGGLFFMSRFVIDGIEIMLQPTRFALAAAPDPGHPQKQATEPARSKRLC